MKVLLNALQAANRSGTGRYVTELARRLSGEHHGVACTVIWPKHQPPPAGMEVLLRECRPAHKRLYYDQWGIISDVKQLGADLVHYPANIGSLGPVGTSVLTVQDLSFYRNPAWFSFERALYYRQALRRSLRFTKRFIASSQSTADDLMRFLGVPSDRIDVIHLGVDSAFAPAAPDAVARVRGQYALPERYFLFMGTLEPRKNVVRLIQAFTQSAAAHDVDLIVAGRKGWKFRPIVAAAEESPVSSRIRFLDYVAQEDVPALMTACEAFVWPSLWEGFGLPPVEAMACGAPVIASNVSSLPEAVGDAAITVDPMDVDALAEAMRCIVTDAALRDRLRERGRARAGRFTWERTAEQTVASYRNAAS